MIRFLKQKNKKNGFTLVETLVAVSIFSMSLVAVMSFLGNGISSTNYAQSKITASYLAQEGIEYIRNMRDTYVLYTSTGWVDFNTKLTNASCNNINNNGCYFDDEKNQGSLSFNMFDPASQPIPMTKILVTNCLGTCPMLRYNSATGKYGYTSGVNSGFTRKIVSNSVSADETKISSTVYWTQGSGTYSITLTESLFNWVE